MGIRLGYAAFKDFNLSLSWYLANTFNQTFDPKISVSSGYTTIYLQTGYVRNQGIRAFIWLRTYMEERFSLAK